MNELPAKLEAAVPGLKVDVADTDTAAAPIQSDVIVTNMRGVYSDHIGAHVMAWLFEFLSRHAHLCRAPTRGGLAPGRGDHLPARGNRPGAQALQE